MQPGARTLDRELAEFGRQADWLAGEPATIVEAIVSTVESNLPRRRLLSQLSARLAPWIDRGELVFNRRKELLYTPMPWGAAGFLL